MEETKENKIKVVEEFKTKHREYKPPYETEIKGNGTKIIRIDTRRKLTPRDREMIKEFELSGYKIVYKKRDITMSDMRKYVKDNYDKRELDLLNSKLDTINSENKENGKNTTYTTIKSWFNSRYVYYPKGLAWNFGKTKSAKEKKERFIKVFDEHKEELKKDWKPIENEDNENTEDNQDNQDTEGKGKGKKK